MRKLLASAAFAAVLGCAFVVAPAEAAPLSSVRIDVTSPEITPVQMYSRRMTRRRMMRNRYGMRRQSLRRGYRVQRGGDPNARNPSRRPGQQNLGQTTGGYR